MKGDKVMKLHIGMTIEEAFDLFSIDDIYVNDINDYYWVKGWYTLFSERIWVNLCFKDRKLWMINLYPHYKENENRAAYEIFSSDERICKEWVEKHKDQLPENTEAYYDHRTPEVGVAIR